MESNKQFIERKNKDFKKFKLIPMKDIGRKGKHYWKREAWTFMIQHNLPEKVFIIERLRKVRISGTLSHPFVVGEVEYRIGYYIVAE